MPSEHIMSSPVSFWMRRASPSSPALTIAVTIPRFLSSAMHSLAPFIIGIFAYAGSSCAAFFIPFAFHIFMSRRMNSLSSIFPSIYSLSEWSLFKPKYAWTEPHELQMSARTPSMSKTTSFILPCPDFLRSGCAILQYEQQIWELSAESAASAFSLPAPSAARIIRQSPQPFHAFPVWRRSLCGALPRPLS